MLKHIAGTAETKHSKNSELVVDDVAVQPNAIDLRLKKVWKLESTPFILDEEGKTIRARNEVSINNDGYYWLWPGAYEIKLGDQINMGANEAGLVIQRSTLNRNGVFITTGLYDSGYEGSMLACLHVTTSLFKVKPDTRVAQFIVMQAESLKQYDGQYAKK